MYEWDILEPGKTSATSPVEYSNRHADFDWWMISWRSIDSNIECSLPMSLIKPSAYKMHNLNEADLNTTTTLRLRAVSSTIKFDIISVSGTSTKDFVCRWAKTQHVVDGASLTGYRFVESHDGPGVEFIG